MVIEGDEEEKKKNPTKRSVPKDLDRSEDKPPPKRRRITSPEEDEEETTETQNALEAMMVKARGSSKPPAQKVDQVGWSPSFKQINQGKPPVDPPVDPPTHSVDPQAHPRTPDTSVDWNLESLFEEAPPVNTSPLPTNSGTYVSSIGVYSGVKCGDENHDVEKICGDIRSCGDRGGDKDVMCGDDMGKMGKIAMVNANVNVNQYCNVKTKKEQERAKGLEKKKTLGAKNLTTDGGIKGKKKKGSKGTPSKPKIVKIVKPKIAKIVKISNPVKVELLSLNVKLKVNPNCIDSYFVKTIVNNSDLMTTQSEKKSLPKELNSPPKDLDSCY